MSDIRHEFRKFAKEKKEWMMLPLLLLLSGLTVVIIFNRDMIHVPFVYSGF